MRDELAKIIADVKKRDSIIDQLTCALEEEKREKTEMVMTIDSLERRLKIYENAHSPPSHGSVPAQQRKARSAERSKLSERAEGKTGGMPGRKPGHAGVSHRRSNEAIHHRLGRCGRCGGINISDARTTAKQVIDIERMPKAVTVTHVCHECVCSDCDVVTSPKQPGIKGTSLGPNLLAFLTGVWGKAVSAGNATALLNDTFGTGRAKLP